MIEIDIEYALRCTKGTLAMEGLICPPEIEKIYRKLLMGKLTKKQSTDEILKYHGIKKRHPQN